MFLDAAELAELETDLESTFDTPCQVLRNSGGRGADGGVLTSFQPVGSAVQGAIWQETRRNRIAENGDGERAQSEWLACLPKGTDVLPGDQITAAGLTLRVSGTDAGATDVAGLLVLCRKVD